MLDNRVLAQLVGALGQVLPHQVLGKREHGQHHVFRNLPTLDVLDGVGNGLPDCLHIQARIVSRQFAICDAEIEFEILPQHFDERRVEARLVVVQQQREA